MNFDVVTLPHVLTLDESLLDQTSFACISLALSFSVSRPFSSLILYYASPYESNSQDPFLMVPQEKAPYRDKFLVSLFDPN